MKKILSLLVIAILAVALMAFTTAKRPVHVFVIGDSTAANKDISKGSPERGWGMVLQGCFTEDVIVDNHARNGRSSLSFINEGLWQKVLDRIQPGDYVLIQFGHNDEKQDTPDREPRHTDPGSTFDANLERYVLETRAKGGIPVLLNCVERRLFFDKNLAKEGAPQKDVDDESLRDTKYAAEKVNTDKIVPTHVTKDGDYTKSPRDVAERLNVPFIDATAISHKMENDYGVTGSRKLHMWLEPGEIASIPDGRQDNTHYSILGAHVISNLLADAIASEVPALAPYVRHYDYVVSDKGRGNYMTLQAAIDAVPKGEKATILVLDGNWQKPKGKNKKITYVVYSTASLK